MKEVNQPVEDGAESAKTTKPVRRYISLSTEEINDLMDTYRSLLKKETRDTQDILISKLEELEEELSFRSKLPKTSK